MACAQWLAHACPRLQQCSQSRSAWGKFVAMVARPPVGDLIGDLKTVTTTMRASVEIVAIDMAARGSRRL